MAKVYDFPLKKLPEEIDVRLDEIAKDYVMALYDVMDDLCDELEPANDEYEEVFMVVLMTLVEKLDKAIEGF